MNKFSIIIAILVIAIAALFYFFSKEKSGPMEEEILVPTGEEARNFRPNPSNATFVFDDGAITLSGGKTEKAVAPGSAITEEIVLMDKFAYGDINADGRDDTALLLARYGGGSGVFIYAAAFVSGTVTYRGSNVFFLGDRIAPQSISIDQGVIKVEYLDREPNEALAAEPTVPRTKQLVYRNGDLLER